MIGKTVKGNGFGGVLRYVFEKPEAQYIGGNMQSNGKRQGEGKLGELEGEDITVLLQSLDLGSYTIFN